MVEATAFYLRPGLLIFNALQLYYLGLTVFFYAEKRTRSICLAALSLFCGASFFAAYFFLSLPGNGQVPAWVFPPAVVVLMLLPLSWYLIVLYYLGVSGIRPLREAPLHAFGVLLTLLLGSLGSVFFFSESTLPSAEQVIRGAVRPADYAELLIVFALYVSVAAGLALAALYLSEGRKGAGVKQLARRRALPAMRLAAGSLFAVALLVTGMVVRLLLDPNIVRTGRIPQSPYLLNLDVVAALFISIAVIASGRAIISYELFSERALPRKGIFRHWRILLVYAFFLGAMASLTAGAGAQAPVLVFVTGLMGVVFFTALGRRSTRDLKKHIRLLRPLTGSHTPTGAPDVREAESAFYTLARDVLAARGAFLFPLGAVAPLAGEPLVYPPGEQIPVVHAGEIAGASPREVYVETNPERMGGAVVGVPLWNERGPAGVLLLREKVDGDVYTQEEAGIAQAAGERILQTLTGARMSGLLHALQNERLIESKLGDSHARRVLHDDILPELHAVMLETPDDRGELVRRLSAVHAHISNLLREMPAGSAPVGEDLVRALRNLPPVSEREAFAEVLHEFSPEAVARCRKLPSRTRDVLYYAVREAVRNALRHGARKKQGDCRLHISLAAGEDGGLTLIVRDNGPALTAGENPEPPGPVSAGAGRGLALHGAMVAVVGGSLVLETEAKRWTRVVIRLGRIELD